MSASESLGSTAHLWWSHACVLGNVCSVLCTDVYWDFDRQTPQVCHSVSLSSLQVHYFALETPHPMSFVKAGEEAVAHTALIPRYHLAFDPGMSPAGYRS